MRELWRYLGKPPKELRDRLVDPRSLEKRGRGRPAPKDDAKVTVKKVVVASGEAA